MELGHKTQIELYLEVLDEHSEKTADMNKASWEKLKIWKMIIGKLRNQVGQTEKNGVLFRQRNGNDQMDPIYWSVWQATEGRVRLNHEVVGS